jgi:hypothetical protein
VRDVTERAVAIIQRGMDVADARRNCAADALEAVHDYQRQVEQLIEDELINIMFVPDAIARSARTSLHNIKAKLKELTPS